MHCVRDCRFSCVIWQKFGFTNQDFFSPNCAQEWIKTGSKGSRRTIFLTTLWWLWRHRNQACFNIETWSITQVCIHIQNSADIIEKSFQQDGDVATSGRLVRWNNNNHHCHILNVDGGCLGSPIRVGYGGLFRTNAGSFLSGFSGYLPRSNCILLDELMAIFKGLRLAQDMGLEDLVCYTDSILSVNLITCNTSKYHAYAVIIQDIKDVMASHNFIIQHTLREGNQCADFMAKLGASSDSDFVLHLTAPQELLNLLRADAMGTLFPRA
jgi:ribonuclease HI